ncbi:MAG: ATP-binding protein [Brevundimonas sp.]|uniref:AlbA family DNA-binding domain-containing protein n=1 Tax=Brevundimonas sp. TaxID=1871086 RepID=UPI0024874780|nr:ATP-binding protein [Brevundimonas sp.]MDI1328132.1 ATP-binding protein [Brevundimonas sp.]
MNIDDAVRLITSGEGLRVELKAALPTRQVAICKEIAALASTDGGHVFLGVSDDGVVVGMTTAERSTLGERLESWVRHHVSPLPLIDLEWLEIDGLAVLCIAVERGSSPLYYFDRVPYIRVGTISHPAEPHQVLEKILGWSVTDKISDIKKDLTATHPNRHTAAAIFGQGELATMNYETLLERLRRDLLS